MREGAELMIQAGQLYEIPPFHDTEVIGDEPYMTVTWNPSTGFAEPKVATTTELSQRCSMTDIVDSTRARPRAG